METSLSLKLQQPTNALDYVSVLHVVSLYCHIVDRAMQAGDTPDVSDLFHPEAEFTTSFQSETFKGRDAVTQWYRTYLGKRKGYFRYTRHKIYTPCIEVNGDTAVSSCHFDADSLDFGGVVRRMSGRYDDVLQRHNGTWLIRKRHIDIHYIPNAEQAAPFHGWR